MKKFPKIFSWAPYCAVSLLWVIVCQLEKKEANLLIWTSTHFCPAHLCWQTAPYSQKHQSHSFDVYGLFILPISRSLEYPIPAYLLSFCFWRRSLFSDCDSKGENNQQHYQWNIFNCQTLLDLGNCLANWAENCICRKQCIFWKHSNNCKYCPVLLVITCHIRRGKKREISASFSTKFALY